MKFLIATALNALLASASDAQEKETFYVLGNFSLTNTLQASSLAFDAIV